MQSMSVKPGQVIALSGQIRGGASGIQSKLDDLDNEVGKLRASWSGSAQLAYDDAQRKWTQSVNELNSLLQQIASKTEEIAQHYTQSDNSSAGRFSI
ncbi:WXG100 family type VII secretion target [Schumannella sp. 10F1B-5-1]|nr:WXG100 family type VII secretion target [Schumannella sp. 10F1B-5-1]